MSTLSRWNPLIIKWEPSPCRLAKGGWLRSACFKLWPALAVGLVLLVTPLRAQFAFDDAFNAKNATGGFVKIGLLEPTLSSVDKLDSTLARQKVVETYGKLPLSFEANAGQTDDRVRFLSRGPGYTLFLTSSEAVLVSGKDRPHVARMNLVGANLAPEIRGVDELSAKSYYFIGNDPKKWYSKVANFARVRYKDVYPGIDLAYYGNQRQLECDFVVKAGADPKSIQLSFPGARQIRIDPETGDLQLDCTGGEVRFHKPLAYQVADGKSLVEARYVLKGGKEVGITLGSYDAAKSLIIDPVLSYSTYLGGSGLDIGSGIAVDTSGNAYVTGVTQSPDFPTVHPLPAPNNALRGRESAFVSKLSFNSATSTLQLAYSAYLGGSVFDFGTGIAVDASGNAYVTGDTLSPDFPTVHPLPAPNNALRGPRDAFVSKLSFDSVTSTLSLAYSTYLGGSGRDQGGAIAVDTSGNAYVTGTTESPDFPTVHPLPPPNNALRGTDAFVSKLSFDTATSTLALAYSTYLGGSGIDEGFGIAVDSSGNAYVTGTTFSPDFPTVHPLPAPNNALQGIGDAFVSKLSFDTATSTLSLAYSTYLGGSGFNQGGAIGYDQGTGIAVDASGNAYVTGDTKSTDFPTVHPLPAPNNALRGTEDAFVSKLSFNNVTSTLSLAYSTYLGGSGVDVGSRIAVDSSGNAYVTGLTQSTDFPTVNPLPAPNNALHGTGAAFDAFVSKLSFDTATSTLSLAYSTYLGGSGDDVGSGIAVDASGNAYVTGFTQSTDFPTVHPLPAPNNALRGDIDAFVAKLTPLVPFATSFAKLEVTAGGFDLNESFTLGRNSNGIKPVTEKVTLQIGTFSVTIPAGSFRQIPHGKFAFEGVIKGVSLEAQIVPLGNNMFTFKAEGTGVNLSGLKNPVTVVLTIGNNTGSTAVNAEFE
jgi:hypothetical protein